MYVLKVKTINKSFVKDKTIKKEMCIGHSLASSLCE